MYSSALASPFGRPMARAQAYHLTSVQTGVTAASPHHLIAMLFDGYMDAISQARGAMRAGQIETKCRALSRAVRIVDEGLKASLDMTGGGTLAADLAALYEYVTVRLTQANLHNDEARLEECQRLIKPLRDAWNSIAPEVANQAL